MLSFKLLSDEAAFICSKSSANAQPDAYPTVKPQHKRSLEYFQLHKNKLGLHPAHLQHPVKYGLNFIIILYT